MLPAISVFHHLLVIVDHQTAGFFERFARIGRVFMQEEKEAVPSEFLLTGKRINAGKYGLIVAKLH